MRFTEPSRQAALEAELALPQASPDLWPPCSAACPVGTSARGYLYYIAAGDYATAFQVAREPNPIVSICAYICHHPCEQACRRNAVDSPLAIRDLKRWAVEHGRPPEKVRDEELLALRAPATGRSVAIVGSGPAGLAAAEALSLAGHTVTVFERQAVAGGQLANTIPLYRLPREAVAADVREIRALGVEIRTSVDIGVDVALPELIADYDAVILAIGLSRSRSLPIEGVESGAVWLALPFLEACAEQDKLHDVRGQFEGRRVIVVGGGNVAVDVARCAVRLGPQSVKMVCLESSEEMPAWPWEIEEAAEEGIAIQCSQGPKRIVVEDGRCRGLETKAVKCVFDEQGRFAPEFYEDRVSMIEGDTVILAIGQAADLSLLETAGHAVKVDGRGRLEFDPERMRTSEPGVFACGEVVSGPGAAIEAAASGKRAAAAVMDFLATGKVAPVPLPVRPIIDDLPERVAALVPRVARETMPQEAAAARTGDFRLFEKGLTEKAALTEARRCLLCGAGAIDVIDRCSTCVTCERVCPFGVPSVKNAGWMPALTCQACGVCVAECPAGSITMDLVDPFEARHEVERAIAAAQMHGIAQASFTMASEASLPGGMGGFETVIIACRQHRERAAASEYPAGVVEALVACAGRIRVEDVLLAYELGARRVVVSVCEDGEEPVCRWRVAGMRAEQRLSLVPSLLEQAGIDPATFRVVRQGNNTLSVNIGQVFASDGAADPDPCGAGSTANADAGADAYGAGRSSASSSASAPKPSETAGPKSGGAGDASAAAGTPEGRGPGGAK